jgi:hypothetical protein
LQKQEYEEKMKLIEASNLKTGELKVQMEEKLKIVLKKNSLSIYYYRR